MKRNFVPRVFIATALMATMAFSSHAFYGDEPTEAEKKEQAQAQVKLIAEKAAKEAMPELIKAGIATDEAKNIIKGLIESTVKELKVKDFDGVEKTLETIFKELQAQHDALDLAFKNKGNQTEKGSFVEFVLKNIEENKDIENDRTYSAKTTIKAAALMTTANVIPNVAGGFSPLFGNYIDTEIGHVPKPENVILPLITVKNQPGTESIWFSDRINEEGDAEFIAEGALKPLADAEWKTSKAAVKEVAVRWKFTKRLMNHAPSVVSDFLDHANELVEQKIDDQLLDGDNLGNNLQGLASVAAAFVVPPQLAEFYEKANIYDVINAMATRIRLSNFKGTITAVLNTVWKAKMLGYKDNEGRYLVPDFVAPDGTQVSDVRVVYSNKIGDDQILIGDLRKFVAVWAENVEYDEGYENDDFSKNLVSRKLEAFIGTYIKASDAGSILYDDITSVLTDIAAPATT